MRVPLGAEATANVKLDGSGNGTAKVGPSSGRETWYPANAHVFAATTVKEATCIVYAGTAATSDARRDATFTGSSGDTTDAISADVMKTGQYVFAVWTGGDANTQAFLNVTGEREI